MKSKRILAASAAFAVAAMGLSVQAGAAGKLELLVEPMSTVDGAKMANTNRPVGGERAASPMFYWNDDVDGIDGLFDITASDVKKWRSTGKFTYTPVDCNFIDFDDYQVDYYYDSPKLVNINDGGRIAYKYDGSGSIENVKTSKNWFHSTYDGWTIEVEELDENETSVTATYYGDGQDAQITKKFTHDGSGIYVLGTQNEEYLAYIRYCTNSYPDEKYANQNIQRYINDFVIEGLTREGELVEIYSGSHHGASVTEGSNFLHYSTIDAPYAPKDYVYLTETDETKTIYWDDNRPNTVKIHEVNDNVAVVEAKDPDENSIGFMLIPLDSEFSVDFDTYKYIGSVDGKIYLVQTSDDKWGYINSDGELLATYDDAGDFMGKYAPVIKDGKAFLINRDFKRVSEKIDAEGVVTLDKGLYRVTINNEEYFMTYGEVKESGSDSEDKPEEPTQPTEPETPEDNEPSGEAPAQGEDTESGEDKKGNPDTGAASAGFVLAVTVVAGSVLLISRKSR